MIFKIIISDEAKIDIERSYLYYQRKVSKKVADHFFKDFKSSLNIISTHFLKFGMKVFIVNQ
jgi:hypothetical protein